MGIELVAFELYNAARFMKIVGKIIIFLFFLAFILGFDFSYTSFITEGFIEYKECLF